MRTKTTRGRQQGVQSVEIGLKVATALATSPSGGLGLGELAKITAMPASKVHRYVVSLCRMGLAEQNPRTGRYDLSWAAMRLGLAAESRLPYLDGLGSILDQLHHSCGVPVAAAIWTSRGPAVVRKAESEYRLIVDTRIGAPLSIGNSSIGRVFAAYLPASVVDPLLDREIASGAPPRLGGRKLSKTEFREYLESVREQGMAYQQGDLIAGLQAIAAPVLNASGRIVLSLSMVSLAGQRNLSPEGDAAAELLATASELSARLATQA